MLTFLFYVIIQYKDIWTVHIPLNTTLICYIDGIMLTGRETHEVAGVLEVLIRHTYPRE